MMRTNKFLLVLFGTALCACSILSSCAKEDDDENDLAEQEEQIDQDSKRNSNG